MKTLVIVAHPDLPNSKINLAWTKALKDQEEITVHLLYDVYPDWKIDVAKEQQLLDAHDRIVLQYPLYWYSTPPLLKLWFDLVLEYGWAFGPGGDHLRGKEIGAAISTGGTAASYQPGGYNVFTIAEIARPIEALTYHVHAGYISPFTLYDSRQVTEEQLQENAAAYLQYLTTTQPVNIVPVPVA